MRGIVVCAQEVPVPIWKSQGLLEEPEIEISRWRVFETETGERHFVGVRAAQGTGRVSSSIIEFDILSRTGVTASGRRYVLVGEPGTDDEADYVWGLWARVNGVILARDVTYKLLV